jgi:hypothetical protein
MNMENLVIQSGDLILRELKDNPDDIVHMTNIIRKCAINSTAVLFVHFVQNEQDGQNPRPKEKMQITSKKEKRIARLLDQFIEFEKELTPADKDNKDTLKKFYLKKCDAIKNKSDSLLFASYGPIQAPLDQGSFDKSVREFIDKAKKTRMQKDRKYFRMGIYLSENLIGCLTFEFNLIKTEGYNKEETTLDPGIFIDPAPAYRARNETGPKRWEEVLALMVAFIGGEGSEFYPPENIKIPISVTTHHLNYETKNMFANVFEEYTKNPVYHEGFGERRFFTIGFANFIKKFELNKPKITVTPQGDGWPKIINPQGYEFGKTAKIITVPRDKII